MTIAALASTAALADAASEWLTVRVGLPDDAPGWTRCGDVDAGFVAGWEAEISTKLADRHGLSHPMTASGYVLGWYAGMAGHIGGAFFRLARRVPRLDRAALAFRLEPDERYPDAVALLDERFWCLPGDPDAGDQDATVVHDDRSLAAVLRKQVRAHAADFLADYRGGARLPRRHLLGAFFDGLDVGLWFGGDRGRQAAITGDARLVLPGDTGEFRDASSIHRLTDGRGREHLSRRRISCCYYYKVADGGQACTTCPRTGDAERARRYTKIDT